jgi:hypothetical protein
MMEDHMMTQATRCFESGSDSANQSEEDTQVMAAPEFVKACPDIVRMNIEIAREWAFLGGD